jgi:uncharacterized protein involved in exopolysaccharide biosynthesis
MDRLPGLAAYFLASAMSKLPQILCGGLLLGLGLGLLANGLWQLAAPFEYRASARLDLVPAAALTNSFANIEDAADLLPQEMEVLRSEKILDRVAAQLDLRHIWSKPSPSQSKLTTGEIMIRLRRQMDLRMAADGYVIDLGFISHDPKEAARLANATAEAYEQYLSEVLKKQAAIDIQQFEKDRDRVKLKQAAFQTTAIQLQASLHVPETQTESNASATFQPYWAAKHEAEKYTNILALLEQKIAAEKLAATQPPPPTQLLITPAETPQQPCWPDRRLGAGMAGGGLMLTLLGYWYRKRSGRTPLPPAATPVCRPAGC